MMLLLKGFFRKKSTKLYILILVILNVAIISLMFFVNYYKGLLNEVFVNNTILYVIGQNDYYKEFSKYDSVINIEKILVVKPDYTYDTLGRQGYVIQDGSTGIIIDSSPSTSNLVIPTWEEFIGIHKNNRIIVRKDDNLKEDEITLSFNRQVTYDILLSSLINKKIGIINNNISYEFVIENIIDNSKFSEMFISSDMYDKIEKENNIYAYKVTLDDYYDAQLLVGKLDEAENNDDFYVSLNTVEDANDQLSMSNLIEITDTLINISYVILVLFYSIIFIILRNIVKDENNKLTMLKFLGYNKIQNKLVILIELIALMLIVLIVSIIITSSLNIFLNNKFNLLLKIFDILTILKIEIIIFIFIFVLSITVNKNEKA